MRELPGSHSAVEQNSEAALSYKNSKQGNAELVYIDMQHGLRNAVMTP